MSSNCLNINIGLRESVFTANVKVTNEQLTAVVAAPSCLSVDIRLIQLALRLNACNIGKELTVKGSNVCGVDFSWDTLYDLDGVALFDAENKRLLINIK